MLYRHDSPALEHGVKSGDILHFVDGEPVHSKSEEDVTAMLKGPCYSERGGGVGEASCFQSMRSAMKLQSRCPDLSIYSSSRALPSLRSVEPAPALASQRRDCACS